jgi:hypothetical protein
VLNICLLYGAEESAGIIPGNKFNNLVVPDYLFLNTNKLKGEFFPSWDSIPTNIWQRMSSSIRRFRKCFKSGVLSTK